MAHEFKGTEDQEKILIEYIDSLKAKNTKGMLMSVMQHAQEIYGYLPIEVQLIIADQLDISLEEVYGVATFYSQFSLVPSGKHKIGVCLGTACYVKGSGVIIERFEQELGIKRGETSDDAEFTLEATRCIGCCGLAPVFTVDGEVIGKAVPDDAEKTIHKCKVCKCEEEARAAEAAAEEAALAASAEAKNE